RALGAGTTKSNGTVPHGESGKSASAYNCLANAGIDAGIQELSRHLEVRNRLYSPIFSGQIDSFMVTFRSDNQPKYPPAAPGSPQLYLSCGRHEFSTGYELPSLCCPCFAAFC